MSRLAKIIGERGISNMKKIAMSVAVATMLLGGLTACGGDDAATGMNANYRSTGFEAQDTNGAYTNSRYRGQGPVTDMMTPDDRGPRYGTLDRQGARTHLNNYSTRGLNEKSIRNQRALDMDRDGYRINQNAPGMGRTGLTGGNRPGMVDEDGLLRGRARNGNQRVQMYNQHRDANGTRANSTTGHKSYHQSQQRAQNGQHAMNYHKDYDSQTAQNIANRVVRINGVDDCRVIVHNDDVVVGVEANKNADQVQQKVERTVQTLANGKNVHVVTDADIVGRIRTMDDQLRTGTAFDEVTDTFTDMLGDLGNAVQRPFERMQR